MVSENGDLRMVVCRSGIFMAHVAADDLVCGLEMLGTRWPGSHGSERRSCGVASACRRGTRVVMFRVCYPNRSERQDIKLASVQLLI